MSEIVNVQTGLEKKGSPKTPKSRKLSGKNSVRKNIPFYLILLPAVITVFMMQYLPLLNQEVHHQ